MSDIIQHPNVGDVDMNALQSVFQSAANAIVKASELGKEVGMLREQVATLTHDVNNLRSSNDALVRELQELRTERADLQAKLRDAEWARDCYRVDHESEKEAHVKTKAEAETTADNWRTNYMALETRWHETLRQRDDAELKIMELEEELRKAEGTLTDIRQALGASGQTVRVPQGVVKEATPASPEPQAAVEDLPGVSPWREYEPGDVWNSESRKWEKQIRHPDGTFGEKIAAASGE